MPISVSAQQPNSIGTGQRPSIMPLICTPSIPTARSSTSNSNFQILTPASKSSPYFPVPGTISPKRFMSTVKLSPAYGIFFASSFTIEVSALVVSSLSTSKPTGSHWASGSSVGTGNLRVIPTSAMSLIASVPWIAISSIVPFSA